MPTKDIHTQSYIKRKAVEAARLEWGELLGHNGAAEVSSVQLDSENTVQGGDISALPREETGRVSPESGEDGGANHTESDNALENFTFSNSDSTSSSGSDSENEDESDFNKERQLKHSLQVWSSQFNVTSVAINSLLCILRPFHPTLPKDARTLKRTPRQTSLKVLRNGQYAHLGLKSGILSSLKGIGKDCEKILVDVFVDGVKVQKNVETECWPILARCPEVLDSRPFVVGLFHGEGKPDPISDYLADHITEVKELQAVGIVYGERHFSFDVRFYLADAVARAYLKCIVGHTSYHGCERCDQEGHFERFVIYSTKMGLQRSDESFDNRRDFEHHKGDSPLAQLGTKFITQFPLDPMHLVEIGIMKRFMDFVIRRGPVRSRMRAQEIQLLSTMLLIIGEYIPYEFTRKPTLKRLSKWKATEFRLMLLYIGPVLLKSVLQDRVYKLFLLLHCGIFLLSSPVFIQSHLADSCSFLEMFVSYSAKVLGNEFVVYNVHSLLHLSSDVERFGSIISFSAYPFEDRLGGLKKLVHSSSKPLQQICRRLSEKEKIEDEINSEKFARGPIFDHTDGPVGNLQNVVAQYSRYEHQQFTVSIHEPNNCVCLSNGNIGLVQNIVKCGDENSLKIILKVFESASDLYEYPMPSSDLGICIIRDLSGNLIVHEFSDILFKCMYLPYNDDFVALPLLHLL